MRIAGIITLEKVKIDMTKSWQEIITHYNNTDKSKAWGYRHELKTNDLSIEDIRKETSFSEKNEEIENRNDLIHAVETLDIIICQMMFHKIKSIRYKTDYRYQCRVLIVSLAIGRGLNAELCKKDTQFIIVDCY